MTTDDVVLQSSTTPSKQMEHAEFSESFQHRADHSPGPAEGLSQDISPAGGVATSASDSQRLYSPPNATGSSLEPGTSFSPKESQATDLEGSEGQFGSRSQMAANGPSQASSLQNGVGTVNSSRVQASPEGPRERGQPLGRADKSSAAATGRVISNFKDDLPQQLEELQDKSGNTQAATASSSNHKSRATSQPSPGSVDNSISSASKASHLRSLEPESQIADRSRASSSKEGETVADAVGGRAAEEQDDAGTGLASFADIESSQFGRYAL